MIVLDDPSQSEDVSDDGSSQTTITPLINLPQCLLDLDIQQKPVVDEVSQSKTALEGLNLLDSQSILPEPPTEQKEKPELPPLRSDPLKQPARFASWPKQSATIFCLCLVVPAASPCLITRERRMTS